MATCTDDLDSSGIKAAWDDRFNTWDQIANDAVSSTNDYLNDIANQVGRYRITMNVGYSPVVDFDPVEVTIPGIDLSKRPLFDLPGDIYNPEFDKIPDLPPSTIPFPDQPPEPPIAFGPRPDPIEVDIPTDAPTVSDPTLPPEPTLTYPDVPVLEDILIPTVPVLDFPDVSVTVPEFFAPTPPAELVWQEPDYTSPIRTNLVNKILEWLLGGTGLPEWIWQRIWDKARTNEIETGLAAIQMADQDAASRGFSIPPGIRNKRVQEAEATVLKQSNTLNREVAIQRAQMEVENIRFAVQQGITMEGMFIDEFQRYAQRTLDAAIATVSAGVQIYNAHAAVYQIQVEAVRAQVEIANLQIQQELSKLEAYKAELDGKRIVAELNRLDVEIYTQQLQALLTQVQVYRAQLEGVNTLLEVDKTKLEAFKTEVEAAVAYVDARKAEFDAYKTEVEAEGVKADVYRTQVAAFAGVIDAIKAETDINVARQDAKLDQQRLKLARIQADVDRYRGEIDGEVAEIQAWTAGIKAQVAAYASQAGVQEANARIVVANAANAIENEKTRASIALQEAAILLSESRERTEMATQALVGVANTQAQVAGSALSAVNLSASFSVQDQMQHSFSETCP